MKTETGRRLAEETTLREKGAGPPHTKNKVHPLLGIYRVQGLESPNKYRA
jgi:hypothetical protein